ncbi:MAG: trypsin-like peptidase domain-containing protein [Myxococcaceae bacterium]|jgi:serine protease Do|nr:trypsin-like peptidase domain-containing protein [Myxococcaceae bacterium]
MVGRAADDSFPCWQCSQPAPLGAATCTACRADLRVNLTLRGPVVDARTRYELGRALGPRYPLVKAQLTRPQPLLLEGVTRAEAGPVVAVLSAHLLDAELRPVAVRRRVVLARAGAAAAALTLVVGAALLVSSRSRSAPSDVNVPAPTTVLPAPTPPPPPAEGRAGPSIKAALRSVVSVRCKDSVGSGFFVATGKVVTNAHVLCDQGAPEVVLADGTRTVATSWAHDRPNDLAVLEVPQLTAPPLPLGDAATAEVGSAVVMIGSPRGLDFTVNRGTLSYVGRGIGGVAYLQVDIAVNPGNSGGPLLDAEGKVIGIVTARIANADGIGFALPINYLPKVIPVSEPLFETAAWKALRAKAEAEPGPAPGRGGLDAPGPKLDPDFGVLLVKAQWQQDRRTVTMVVVTTDVDPNQRFWDFSLRIDSKPTCTMTRVKNLAWVRLRERDPEVTPEVAQVLKASGLENKVFIGVMSLQWSTCPQANQGHLQRLSLVLAGAAKGHDEVTLSY